MAHATHSARITGPIAYVAGSGERVNIPLGPCLIEEPDEDEDTVDVFWGPAAEKSAAVPLEVIEAAEASGDLVLLD
jgi:hypothetical protein